MIKRTILTDLIKHLEQKEISLIIGPRQAGKTTLMLACQDLLEKKGEEVVYLNLDIEGDKQFFVSQETLIQKIQLEVGFGPGFVFIDEIQRKQDAGVFLKGIYDMGLPYKFIVSGSGSLELKEKIHESLVGRKRIFELFTLNFPEFVNFKTNYKYEEKLTDFFRLDQLKVKTLLEEYLTFGGYPRVVLSDLIKEKRKTIQEIYQSFLEKDIAYLLGLQKTGVLTNLIKVLASQVGGLVNFSELSSTLGLSAPTVKNYLWYLEKTFIVGKITPFFRNVRKETTKSPIFYFHDLGLRNFALGIFGQTIVAPEAGHLFENFVFTILKERIIETSASLHFWRTKEGAEVDFVVNLGRLVLPIEVKYQTLKAPKISRSLRSFIEKYHPPLAWVVNLSLKEETRLNGTKLVFMPFTDLFFADLTNL